MTLTCQLKDADFVEWSCGTLLSTPCQGATIPHSNVCAHGLLKEMRINFLIALCKIIYFAPKIILEACIFFVLQKISELLFARIT